MTLIFIRLQVPLGFRNRARKAQMSKYSGGKMKTLSRAFQGTGDLSKQAVRLAAKIFSSNYNYF